MGVMSLLRNDVALSAVQTPIGGFIPPETDLSKDHIPVTAHCAGRVLVLKTKPTGAVGPVWHLNVYQYTSSAPAASRAAVWEACSRVVQEAQEQGACVVVGGDFNATTGPAQRASGVRSVDRACQKWLRDNRGAAAVPSYEDNQAGNRSWRDPRGRHDADLDHIAVFPSTIPLTY